MMSDVSTFHTGARWKSVRRAAIWRWQMDGRPDCPLCGRPIRPEAGDKVHVDHVHPVGDGGRPYDPTNVRITHASCNLSRDRGGTSYDAGRRRRLKEAAGWKIAPEDARRRGERPDCDVIPAPSRDW